MSQEIAATGDAKTSDAANTIVPTLCQKTKRVDLPPVNRRLPGIQGLLVQMLLERKYGEGEKDDEGHFAPESVDIIQPGRGIWALARAPDNQDRDDELVKEFPRTWLAPRRQRPPVDHEEHVKGLGYYFLLSNALAASPLNAEWDAKTLDQKIVASVEMRLRNCFRWNPKTPKDVQVWAKNLGNMFGGGRQSFREHLAEGAPLWQVGRSRKKVSQRSVAAKESSHTTIVVSTMCSSSSLVGSNAELHSIACVG